MNLAAIAYRLPIPFHIDNRQSPPRDTVFEDVGSRRQEMVQNWVRGFCNMGNQQEAFDNGLTNHFQVMVS